MKHVSPYRCEHIADFKTAQSIASHFARPRHRDDASISTPQSSSKVPLASIRESAQRGCLFCPIILAAVEPNIPERYKMSTVTVAVHKQVSGLRINIHSTEDNLTHGQYLKLICSEDTGEGLIPCVKPERNSTASDTAFRQLAEWFVECLTTHRLMCHSMSLGNGVLPHRVLDLGSGPGDRIYLRETREEKGKYACLSHSWGGHQPIQATKASLEERKKGIPWDDLPQTFQDAITMTRGLTLRYIWIDSLCIIQDDNDDWLVESALMADIYRNALITISASASKGPHDGLFRMTTEKYSAVKLTHPLLSAADDQAPQFFVRKDLPHERTQHPLLDRGWVFQERLLSPRVIHFGTYELIWECMEKQDCECGKRPSRLSWFLEKSFFHPDMLAARPLLHTANTWRQIVRDFCALALTFERDAFPAVSGAAKMVKQSLRERGVETRYIAGMWECWFVEDCLWSTSFADLERTAVRPEKWRAPTFSWASVRRGERVSVQYRSNGIMEQALRKGEESIDPAAMTLLATLEEFECKTMGADEMGPISSAYVVLRGPLMKAKLVKDDMIVEGQKIYEYPEFSPDYDYSVEGQHHIDPAETLWCLQLVSLRVLLDEPRLEYLWCLVLRKIDVHVDGKMVFERVGLMRYREHFNKGKPVAKWFDPAHVESDAMVRIV